jgi:DNA-binding MarR family transcriptional regulator
LRISSEFVRGINEMARKKTKAASQPKRKRKVRNLRQHGLTPTAVRALWSLDRERGKALGTLAKEWECDNSHASHIVAELVTAGYARRPRNPNDGRFRHVTLTDAGVAIKGAIVSSS